MTYIKLEDEYGRIVRVPIFNEAEDGSGTWHVPVCDSSGFLKINLDISTLLENPPTEDESDKAPTSEWAFDHAADLDAHQYDALLKVRTGDSYFQSHVTVSRGNSGALTLDQLNAVPIYIPRAITFDLATIHVKTLDAGESLRLGIYNNGTNLYPGTLLEDFGAASVNATGIITVSISPTLTLQPGLYWLATLASATTAEVYCYTVALGVLGINTTNFTLPLHTWSKSSVSYGALPDPFTAGGTFTNTTKPSFYLRPSALV